MKKSFLAALTPSEFLQRHWQKKPLLARGALCEHVAAVDRDTLFALAARDTVESRVVAHARGRWRVRHGPFTRRELESLPRTGWTLLVQGVDAEHRGTSRLLQAFSFLPYARVDDVMVSYAATGGGVGPHFDSYDVFLVQGAGRRRWRIGRQRDLELVADAPLKLLRRFEPQDEWTLEPGDVLYLPPRWAHDGVALEPSITYSVGFRAPSAQELGSRFLEFLQDRLELNGGYADPDLQPVREPARIPDALIGASARMLERLRWSRRDVAEFLGRYLSEPKANVVYARPEHTLTRAQFARTAQRAGVRLALSSRMLFEGRHFFMNGECVVAPLEARGTLSRLANDRAVARIDARRRELLGLLYAWYLAGYIELGNGST